MKLKLKLELQKNSITQRGKNKTKKKQIQNIKLNKKECEAICSKCGKLAQWSKVGEKDEEIQKMLTKEMKRWY